jgi:hypothetical protein
MAAINSLRLEQFMRHYPDMMRESFAFGKRAALEEHPQRTAPYGGNIGPTINADNYINPGDAVGERVIAHIHSPASQASFALHNPDNPNRLTRSPFRRAPHIYTISRLSPNGSSIDEHLGWTTGLSLSNAGLWVDKDTLKEHLTDKNVGTTKVNKTTGEVQQREPRGADAAKTRNTAISGIISSTPRSTKDYHSLIVKPGYVADADTGEDIYEHPLHSDIESKAPGGLVVPSLGRRLVLGNSGNLFRPSALYLPH